MGKRVFDKFIGRSLTVGAGILCGLAIAEAGLRVLGVSYLPQGIFFMPDQYLGWVNRPGIAGEWYAEGPGFVKINSSGLRDREHSKDKPANTLRVAILGDSFAAAFQVSQSQDFSSIAERSLVACTALRGRTPEIINFGVNAYGTAQELITLERRVWQYSPDVIVLAFYPNDLYDNSRELSEVYPAFTPAPRPYFYYHGNDLVLDDSFRNSSWFRNEKKNAEDDAVYGKGVHRLLWRLRVWQLFSRVRPALKAPVAEQFDGSLLNAPKTDEWRDAWHVTEGLILRMNSEVRARHIPFLLVLVTEPLQVYPGKRARSVRLGREKVDDPLYLNRAVRTFAEGDHIEILSLAEPLQKYADAHHMFLHGFGKNIGYGHWNKAGHQLAGEMIADRLCDLIGERQ